MNNAAFSAGFQFDGFGVIIPIPDDTIVEPSEGYVYILEVIGPLDPRDIGRIDSTTNVTLVTILDNDRRLHVVLQYFYYYKGSFKADGWLWRCHNVSEVLTHIVTPPLAHSVSPVTQVPRKLVCVILD